MNIELKNKPLFLNNDILKELLISINANKKIKDISSIRFNFKEDLNDKLVYQISIECNSATTFIGGIEIFSGNDVYLLNVVFDKKNNFKVWLYW